ncbi:endonuclease subunit [uncultured Caudovirales phage]|uniref:Endonuclease subunit n=1 Tax=uncultured Caudovirales phage TaxID=2100421 RepID=A0A6J5KUA6_9CAUD|nr:endonuclease subunit [uncultured Caudovirales phage]
MSRILFIGDPHLKITNFEQSIAFLRWVEEITELHNPDIVCNLGDTFDTHAVVRAELMSEFKRHVEVIATKRPYWYVLGNHDQFKPKDAKYHALQCFNISNFVVFDKITELEGITVVPYVAKFEDFPLQTQSICITHNTFIGADYGFKREDCGVNADKVSADIIISGHIHRRQSFGKVTYPGTPFANSANDVDQSKGVLLFDTENFEQKFIESPFTRWRGLEFEVTATNTIQHLHEMLKVELNTTDKWIIKASGPKIELAAYFKSEMFLSLIKGKKVVTKAIPTDKNKQKVQIKATSIEDIMSEYVNKVYDGGLDKQLILNKINDIITNTR